LSADELPWQWLMIIFNFFDRSAIVKNKIRFSVRPPLLETFSWPSATRDPQLTVGDFRSSAGPRRLQTISWPAAIADKSEPKNPFENK
jgi:hypothetical protein